MAENMNLTDYISSCREEISLAQRRIAQVNFLTILASYGLVLSIFICPIVLILLILNFYLVLALLYRRFKMQIVDLYGSIEHAERTVANVNLASGYLQHYNRLREQHDLHNHETIEQGESILEFSAEYKGKNPDMPVYRCPLCKMKLEYFGFYMRNRWSWKGTLQDLENEWLKYDHNNPKNNVKMELLCCTCHDKIEQENRFMQINWKENGGFSLVVLDAPLPVRNALDLNGNHLDLDDFNFNLYGLDNENDQEGKET